MIKRQDIQPVDESSGDEEARERGSASGNPGGRRRRDAETGEIEERIRAAIARAETELREKRTGVE